MKTFAYLTIRDTRHARHAYKIMIRDTRHATREFVFYARHENFKCKKMKILNATLDTSVYLIIEHTDTSVTFKIFIFLHLKCLVYIRSDIFRDRRHVFF